MQHFIPYFIVSFIYAAVAIDFWRTAKLPQASPQQTQSLKLHSSMIALGLALHGWLLYRDVFATGDLNFGFYYALSAILWLTVLIYWLADLSYQLQSLQAFVLPPAALFVLLPAFTIKNYYLPQIDAGLFMAHIAIAILAYSLFTFAALHAALMAIAERNLHKKTSLIQLPNFPPLMVMETLLFKVITIGFILLTLTVISGMLFSEEIFGKPLQFNHKVIFSIASWLIYAWLLYGRYRYGWRGKKAIRWTIIGFVLLLLAYVGSRFVLHVLLNK
ncbi:MAG TPA: cytochrome C biogenesis protein [Methylophilaceae bacterium]|nr:cytochrome C biogenesis protein [Methylophilaceae bacterium]